MKQALHAYSQIIIPLLVRVGMSDLTKRGMGKTWVTSDETWIQTVHVEAEVPNDWTLTGYPPVSVVEPSKIGK